MKNITIEVVNDLEESKYNFKNSPFSMSYNLHTHRTIYYRT